MLGVTVSASSGARAPRPLGRLPAGCSRWRSGQPPSQTVLGSEAMWFSVQDEAPQQVAGRRMCGWLRRLGGRVARCPRRSAGLRVLAFGDLPVPEGARPSVSWERRSDPQSTHGRGEGTPRHQDRPPQGRQRGGGCSARRRGGAGLWWQGATRDADCRGLTVSRTRPDAQVPEARGLLLPLGPGEASGTRRGRFWAVPLLCR